jgi:hypothetical protein
MKIIDEHGNPIENPDLTLGYLKDDPEIIHHEAVEAVKPVTHYEYKTYPNGGRDRWKVVDVPGVAAKEAYDEEVEVLRYILYTADELAAQEKARKEAEEKAQLPTTEERLAALEAAMLDLLAAQQ